MCEPRIRESYERAVRLLTLREHTKLELRRKLGVRQSNPKIVDAVIQRLEDEGYLSEERFIEIFVRSRLNKGQGPLKIQAALRERGISDQLISTYLAFDDEFWIAKATSVDQKKFSTDQPSQGGGRKTQITLWQRRVQFLEDRGFSPYTIQKVVKPFE